MKVVPGKMSVDAEVLYEQMAAGSEQAYYTLFERYWEALYVSATHLLKDRETAKDVVQEVFLSFWEKRGEQPIQNVGAYLHRAAKFSALKLLRDDKSQWHDDLESAQEIVAAEQNALDAKELEQQVSDAINELPERCREVFQLSREEHLTNKEIAEKLNLSQRTVETHISNALKILRGKLPGKLPMLALIVFLG